MPTFLQGDRDQTVETLGDLSTVPLALHRTHILCSGSEILHDSALNSSAPRRQTYRQRCVITVSRGCWTAGTVAQGGYLAARGTPRRHEAVRKSGASTGLSDAVKVSLLQTPKLGPDSSAARRSPRSTAPLQAGLPLLPPPLPVSSAPAPPENSRRFLKRNPAVSGSRQSSPPADRCCYRREGGSRACGSRRLVLTCNGGKRKWPCCATTGAAGSASIPRPIPTMLAHTTQVFQFFMMH